MMAPGLDKDNSSDNESDPDGVVKVLFADGVDGRGSDSSDIASDGADESTSSDSDEANSEDINLKIDRLYSESEVEKLLTGILGHLGVPGVIDVENSKTMGEFLCEFNSAGLLRNDEKERKCQELQELLQELVVDKLNLAIPDLVCEFDARSEESALVTLKLSNVLGDDGGYKVNAYGSDGKNEKSTGKDTVLTRLRALNNNNCEALDVYNYCKSIIDTTGSNTKGGKAAKAGKKVVVVKRNPVIYFSEANRSLGVCYIDKESKKACDKEKPRTAPLAELEKANNTAFDTKGGLIKAMNSMDDCLSNRVRVDTEGKNGGQFKNLLDITSGSSHFFGEPFAGKAWSVSYGKFREAYYYWRYHQFDNKIDLSTQSTAYEISTAYLDIMTEDAKQFWAVMSRIEHHLGKKGKEAMNSHKQYKPRTAHTTSNGHYNKEQARFENRFDEAMEQMKRGSKEEAEFTIGVVARDGKKYKITKVEDGAEDSLYRDPLGGMYKVEDIAVDGEATAIAKKIEGTHDKQKSNVSFVPHIPEPRKIQKVSKGGFTTQLCSSEALEKFRSEFKDRYNMAMDGTGRRSARTPATPRTKSAKSRNTGQRVSSLRTGAAEKVKAEADAAKKKAEEARKKEDAAADAAKKKAEADAKKGEGEGGDPVDTEALKVELIGAISEAITGGLGGLKDDIGDITTKLNALALTDIGKILKIVTKNQDLLKNQLASKDKIIAAKDTENADRVAEIAAKDATIAAKDVEIAAKDAEKVLLTTTNDALEAQSAAIAKALEDLAGKLKAEKGDGVSKVLGEVLEAVKDAGGKAEEAKKQAEKDAAVAKKQAEKDAEVAKAQAEKDAAVAKAQAEKAAVEAAAKRESELDAARKEGREEGNKEVLEEAAKNKRLLDGQTKLLEDHKILLERLAKVSEGQDGMKEVLAVMVKAAEGTREQAAEANLKAERAKAAAEKETADAIKEAARLAADATAADEEAAKLIAGAEVTAAERVTAEQGVNFTSAQTKMTKAGGLVSAKNLLKIVGVVGCKDDNGRDVVTIDGADGDGKKKDFFTGNGKCYYSQFANIEFKNINFVKLREGDGNGVDTFFMSNFRRCNFTDVDFSGMNAETFNSLNFQDCVFTNCTAPEGVEMGGVENIAVTDGQLFSTNSALGSAYQASEEVDWLPKYDKYKKARDQAVYIKMIQDAEEGGVASIVEKAQSTFDGHAIETKQSTRRLSGNAPEIRRSVPATPDSEYEEGTKKGRVQFAKNLADIMGQNIVAGCVRKAVEGLVPRTDLPGKKSERGGYEIEPKGVDSAFDNNSSLWAPKPTPGVGQKITAYNLHDQVSRNLKGGSREC